MLDGVFQRGCKVRISREGEQIFEGDLASLKTDFKDDVKEVKAGFECGLVFEGFNDIAEFDIVEAYTWLRYRVNRFQYGGDRNEKNSIKNTRINGEVLRELSNIIRGEIKDPRINPLTSVVAVEVAPDLKTCKAYISVLGDEEAQAKTRCRVKECGGIYPQQTWQNSKSAQYTGDPFVLDQSIEYGVKMSKMIDEVTKDIKSEDDAEE